MNKPEVKIHWVPCNILKDIYRGKLVALLNFFKIYFASPQGQGHHYSVRQLLWDHIA